MDRQAAGVTSEDEAGEEIGDTQGYLTEMMRELFGSGDLDWDVNGSPRSRTEGIGQASVVPCLPTTQEQDVVRLKGKAIRFALVRAVPRIRRATASGSDIIPAGLIKQLDEGPKPSWWVSSLTLLRELLYLQTGSMEG